MAKLYIIGAVDQKQSDYQRLFESKEDAEKAASTIVFKNPEIKYGVYDLVEIIEPNLSASTKITQA